MDGEGTALAMEISSALNSSHLYTQNDLGGFIQTGGFDTGVLIATPPEDEKFASCFAKALSDIGHLKEVKVNPDRHVASVKMGGTVRMGGIGTMGGGGQIAPGAPLPAGSAVDIMVAVKPIEVAAAPN